MTDQVYEAIVEEICNGEITPGEHLVQEQLAEKLGVSRQPVQQAMSMLKADGLVEQIGRRGLQVAPLDLDKMQHHYDIRAALDGLAARSAAQQAKKSSTTAQALAHRGGDILKRGETAVARGAVGEQVRHDVALHTLIYEFSGNPLLAKTAEPHWRFLRRAMSEVLRYGELPKEIWRQHRDILDAIIAGDADTAERLIVAHDLDAAKALSSAFASKSQAAPS
ncbi:GntR family transcriptional regulator [Ruegeria sediminis]|nr:GntR family transcriptional regulator [Ruegeria sediminis]